MKLSVLYPALWIAWILAFFAIELSAIFTGHARYTLSDLTWRIERVNQGWTFARYVVAIFCLWLAGHLVWGLWR